MLDDTSMILCELSRLYPSPRPELIFTNAYELLIATMLAAQCTDRQVNSVTPALFQSFPSPDVMAPQDPLTIEEYIRPCGFYHTKAANIIAACRIIVEKFDSIIPGDMESLTSLPGVGRKTANVVMSNAFGVDAIAVDTHVFRVSNRLGLADSASVLEVETQLMAAIPKHVWSDAHHYLIFHGRRVCHARKPDCSNCTLRSFCKSQRLQDAV